VSFIMVDFIFSGDQYSASWSKDLKIIKMSVIENV
jgi:hypothetical protein